MIAQLIHNLNNHPQISESLWPVNCQNVTSIPTSQAAEQIRGLQVTEKKIVPGKSLITGPIPPALYVTLEIIPFAASFTQDEM